MKQVAVIGLGFGDEGKGNMVDYLCRKLPNSFVVRFNGGSQVGHTVWHNKKTHIFSHFGSGTMAGAPTYWSKHCPISPVTLLNELAVLTKKEIYPKLYIDAECPVITPYDIMHNIQISKETQHGTCGAGFGTTIEREENFYSLKFIDLFYPNILKEKLRLIRDDYYHNNAINTDITVTECNFLQDCNDITIDNHIELVHFIPPANTYIYEGAQGLLLDQHYGFFPHVTRSNCGSTNIPHTFFTEYYLITRAYHTRHGNGYFPNEINDHILHDKDETNVNNRHQGRFRRTILNLDLLEYALIRDNGIRNSKFNNLVITCLDHLKEFKFIYKDKIFHSNTLQEFIINIVQILSGKVSLYKIFINNNKDSSCIKEINLNQ